MKEYPLTKGELYNLGTIGGLSAVFFSLATGLFGFATTITKDIAFSSSVPETVIVYYSTLRDFAFYGSAFSAFVGVIFLVAGGLRVRQIIKETMHD